MSVRSNKGMKLTKPGELRSFAAYPRCSMDSSEIDRVHASGRRERHSRPRASGSVHAVVGHSIHEARASCFYGVLGRSVACACFTSGLAVWQAGPDRCDAAA